MLYTKNLNRFPVSNFLDDAMKDVLTTFVGNDVIHRQPKINITEDTDGFDLALAIPGVNKEDVKIKVEKEQIFISAEKKNEKTQSDGKKYTRREFDYTSFSKTFNLPETVDKTKISANFENGILNITLPKVEEAKEQAPFEVEIA